MSALEASAKSVQCVIVTPERAVLDESADFVAVPMYDGELGVMPGRAPLIGRLGYGELRTVHNGQTRRFFVDGGFVQIRDDIVTVLTPRALPAEEIRLETAEQALQSAQVPAFSPEARDAQIKDQDRARAQIRIARRLQETEAVS
jgi:F-type H+-transporting ATPase subunit epsilon